VHTAFVLVTLVIGVTAVAALARRLRLSPPLVLVVAGFGLSFLPWLHDFGVNSELVLVGLLPPLLYAAALRTSLVDFARTCVRSLCCRWGWWPSPSSVSGS